MAEHWIRVAPNIKVGVPARVRRALAAGHITGREAGQLHRIAAWLWRSENIR